jgi:hypothetical protein
VDGEEAEEQAVTKHQPTAAPPPPGADATAAIASAPADADPLATALARLLPHMRSSARLPKAGPLLRQLLDGTTAEAAGPALDPARHSAAAFAAVAAAFSDPSQFLSAPPQTRVEYARLARSAQRVQWQASGKDDDAAAAAEAASLYCGECAAAWALLRLELLNAEDGFALSRALGKLKSLVDALPPWDEGDEAEEEEEEAEEAEEKTKPSQAAPPPPPPLQVSWPPCPARVLLLRRRAALDCALCARDHCHSRAWAATAVEMALEHVASRADRFSPGPQRSRAKGLLDFVSSARAARRAGGGGAAGGAGKDDRGAFERARAQFAAAGNVSARGSVGMRGGGAAQWLG